MAAREPSVADPEEVRRIIRLIDSDAQVRDEVRRAILTRELLALPQRLADFIEATNRRFETMEADLKVLKSDVNVLKSDVRVLKSDVRVLKSDVSVLKSDVNVLKSDVTVLKSDVNVLKIDVGDLKGDSYERGLREKAASILSQVAGGVRRIRVIPTSDLADLLDGAVDTGRLSEAGRAEVLNADAVVRGVLQPSRESVYLVVEASVALGNEDVERATRRADLTERGLATRAIPVVVTTRIPDAVSTDGVDVVLFGPEQQSAVA